MGGKLRLATTHELVLVLERLEPGLANELGNLLATRLEIEQELERKQAIE